MPFPESPRVVYSRNPLAEVICKIQFPPILKIASEPPAAFQDAIRSDYPRYQEASAPGIQLPPNMPAELRRLVQGLGPPRTGPIEHHFSSEDGKWTVSLTRDSVALRTTSYQRWEQFRERFLQADAALKQTYQPAAYVTRVGLRYIDVICRSMLGLNNEPWAHLLRPHIAGEFSAEAIAGGIDSAERNVHVKLNDDQYVTLKSGLVANPQREQCFMIDSDFHTHKRTESAHVIRKLDSFNRMGGDLFRWCIDERLHRALGPQPVT